MEGVNFVVVLLLLVPLSRVLFHLWVWIGHRFPNTEELFGIDIARKVVSRLNIITKPSVMLGEKGDYFDPKSNLVKLSNKNNQKTIASTAITMHEIGHAMQYNSGWMIYKFRCKIIRAKIPLIYMSATAIVLGFSDDLFFKIAIVTLICLGICILTELIVEIDASIRGYKLFCSEFKTRPFERVLIKVILFFAAFTYFVDFINSLQIILNILIVLASAKDAEEK